MLKFQYYNLRGALNVWYYDISYIHLKHLCLIDAIVDSLMVFLVWTHSSLFKPSLKISLKQLKSLI